MNNKLEDFPMYSVLKIAWHAKITLLITKFSRSIDQIRGNFQYFQKQLQIPWVVNTMSYLCWPVASAGIAGRRDVGPHSIRDAGDVFHAGDGRWGIQTEQIGDTMQRPAVGHQVHGRQFSLSQYNHTLRLTCSTINNANDAVISL